MWVLKTNNPLESMEVRETRASSKPVLFQRCTESKRLIISKSRGIVAGHWSEFQFNVNAYVSLIVVERQNLGLGRSSFYQDFTLTRDIVFNPVLKSVMPVL